MPTNKRGHPPDPRIATRIRFALNSNEMSQKTLAEMLGVSDSAVSQILGGHTRPLDDTVRRIAEGLGEDFDYLMGYKDRGSIGTGRVIGHILSKSTPEELELLEAIPEEAYHEMMGELALKYAKSRRRRGKTTKKVLMWLLAIFAGFTALDAIDDTFHRAGVAVFHNNAHGDGPRHVAHPNPDEADLPHTIPPATHRLGAR